jgi:hypothetical protein
MSLRTFTPTNRIPSSMARFDNIKKPVSRGEKKSLGMHNIKIARALKEKASALSDHRDKLFRKANPDYTGKNVALIRRRPNQDGKTVFNVAGLGDILGSLNDAKIAAKAAGKTHWRSGVILAALK